MSESNNWMEFIWVGEKMKVGIRITVILLLVLMLLTLCCACGKPFICDWCGYEKTGKKHKMEFYGEEMVFCNDCYKEFKELAKELGG